jgi:hypothetical protein
MDWTYLVHSPGSPQPAGLLHQRQRLQNSAAWHSLQHTLGRSPYGTPSPAMCTGQESCTHCFEGNPQHSCLTMRLLDASAQCRSKITCQCSCLPDSQHSRIWHLLLPAKIIHLHNLDFPQPELAFLLVCQLAVADMQHQHSPAGSLLAPAGQHYTGRHSGRPKVSQKRLRQPKPQKPKTKCSPSLLSTSCNSSRQVCTALRAFICSCYVSLLVLSLLRDAFST